MKLFLLPTGTIGPAALPVPAYLIEADDGTVVLVDTGLPAPDGGTPPVVDWLSRIGRQPSEVDLVVCSHLDPDHCGSNDRFPRSEFVVQRSHLRFARSGRSPRPQQYRERWDRPEFRFREIDGDHELLPGVELVESTGHVPGHQSVLVRLPGQPVLLAIDAIPASGALDPDTRPIYPFDMDESAVRDATRKLVAVARAEKALIVHGHDAAQWATLRTPPACYA
jgi:N-acyl homoserine lactone hydrolase